MSKRLLKDDLPRDAHVVQALRRELHRNSRQISNTFWMEFEQIRSQQRNQLAEERANRERINTLMQDANQEAQQQVEALSRSISSHGINPDAPSPRMRRDTTPAIMPPPPPLLPLDQSQRQQAIKNSTLHLKKRRLDATAKQQPLASKSTSMQLTTTSSQLPRAPPSSRATIVPGGNLTPGYLRAPARSSPTISKLQLIHKPKK